MRVSIVELTIPPITVNANGDQRLAPSVLSIAIGTSPKVVVQTVIKIGLRRSRLARMAARTGLYFFR